MAGCGSAWRTNCAEIESFRLSFRVADKPELITKPSSVSGPTTLLQEADDNESPTDWSPDGHYLLTERFLHGGSEIWLHPLTPGEAARALLASSATKGLQSSGQFSPDGKLMAFTFTTSAGPQVFVVPFPGGNGMWQVYGQPSNNPVREGLPTICPEPRLSHPATRFSLLIYSSMVTWVFGYSGI